MKAITLGLAAALAFSAASAQAASPITFTVTAESGSGALVPASNFTYSYFTGGDRLNVNTVLRDETYTYGNMRYVYHYADTSYDQQGGYRDSSYWSVYGADVAQAPDYIYFKASAKISPDADQTVPLTVTAFSHVTGTYSPLSDPRFPNVKLNPPLATIAAADSHNAADLTTSSSGNSFLNPDGTFSASYSAYDKVVPAGGSLDMGLLFYFPAQLHATSYGFYLDSSLYNVGLYHFSETEYRGLEIQAIPEPTTWAMLLAGVGILGVARRRKTAA